MPVQAPELVYTDVAFAANQDRRARKILRMAIWIVATLQMLWTVGLAIQPGLLIGPAVEMHLAVNAVIATSFALLLVFERQISLRLLAHTFFWIGFFDIWFIQLALEGIPGPHRGSVYLWFTVLLIAVVFPLVRENRLVLGAYAVLTFVSFVVCEFGLIQTGSGLSFDSRSFEIATALTRISIFISIVLLTRAWVREVGDAEQKLAFANNRLEDLLENMLPRSISERLRREGKTFADGIEHCSVLFADLVGFTKFSSSMPADELVKLLDEIFSKFDELTGHLGLEKIKTIGDCYMVGAGLIEPRADHAQALTSLAIEMRDVVRKYGLHIRSGINSGRVVAGVIGKRRFIYDLWGDTVNVASRMESQGVVDEIQVTQATADLIMAEFDLVPRGEIAIKGRGNMPVFLVVGQRNRWTNYLNGNLQQPELGPVSN